jgi:hypothetical protein
MVDKSKSADETAREIAWKTWLASAKIYGTSIFASAKIYGTSIDEIVEGSWIIIDRAVS